APRNWNGFTLVLQRVLNRRLFVWLQPQGAEVVFADAPVPSFGLDGVTSPDLCNDSLSILWDCDFLPTPGNRGRLAIAAQCELDRRFQKHSGCDCPETKPCEYGRESDDTESPSRIEEAPLSLLLTKPKNKRSKDAAGQVARNSKGDELEQPRIGFERFVTMNVAEQ